MEPFFQIYYNNKPEINETVLIKFTDRNESHIVGELVEYNLRAMMSYNDATKKKKIYSWNKIVPLEKLMIAKVEYIYDDGSVQVSTAYNDKKTDIKVQLKPFTENKILISIIKKLCYNFKLNFEKFWVNIIYPLDKLRKEENLLSLFVFFKDNLIIVEELMNTNTFLNVDLILNYLKETLNTISPKITSKIGLISMSGIEKTKYIINQVISNNKENYNVKYDSAPYFIVESLSHETAVSDHEKIINNFQILSRENKIFMKIEYVGKINE